MEVYEGKGKVTKLQIFSKEEKARTICSDLTNIFCIVGVGIQGNANGKDEQRQVTLMEESLNSWIYNQPKNGLCSSKFKANITIDGLDFSGLREGSLLSIGESLLEISALRKKCYGQECKIYRADCICPILTGCQFAKVVKSGKIQLADDCLAL